VFACATIEKYKNEILKINETWLIDAEKMGVKVLFFLGEEVTDLIGDNYIYLPNVKNDYMSASWKQYLGFKYIYENYNAKFIFTCGTDTFINIKNLLLYLDTFKDDERKLYIGGHGGKWPPKHIMGIDVYFHCGGAGFIVTNNILEELYPIIDELQNQWMGICENDNNIKYLLYACDVSISYFLIKYVTDVQFIKNDYFYNCNYLGYLKHYACCVHIINTNTIITCHNMSLVDFDNFQKIVTQL
jgi:hypothetical protein